LVVDFMSAHYHIYVLTHQSEWAVETAPLASGFCGRATS